MDALIKGHLPRLSSEHYAGRTFIHWTLTIEDRATGWLTPTFHHAWQLILVHTCTRFAIVCPTYVLMPHHVHFLWFGLKDESDQRNAVEFLRKYLRPLLRPCDWQRQAHDHVLREHERERNALRTIASYILENPVRAALVKESKSYPYLGCCAPGYPNLDLFHEGSWDLFWRIYNRLVSSH